MLFIPEIQDIVVKPFALDKETIKFFSLFLIESLLNDLALKDFTDLFLRLSNVASIDALICAFFFLLQNSLSVLFIVSDFIYSISSRFCLEMTFC